MYPEILERELPGEVKMMQDLCSGAEQPPPALLVLLGGLASTNL